MSGRIPAVRAAIRLSIEEIRISPGSDWGPGPEFTAKDAFADILGDLLARLDAGDPQVLARLAARIDEEER